MPNMMDKEVFLRAITNDIKELQRKLKIAEGLEINKIYIFQETASANVLGRILKFSYGDMNCTVVLEVLAAQHHFASRQRTIRLSLGFSQKITPVPDTDLPLYIGWDKTLSFEKRLRRLKI